MTPQISLVAYETRDPRKVFVKVPNQRGRWMLTDRCVVEVACKFCGSAIGEPCRSKCHGGRHDYTVDTHYHRRQAYMFSRDSWEVPKLPENELIMKPHYRVMANAVPVDAPPNQG